MALGAREDCVKSFRIEGIRRRMYLDASGRVSRSALAALVLAPLLASGCGSNVTTPVPTATTESPTPSQPKNITAHIPHTAAKSDAFRGDEMALICRTPVVWGTGHASRKEPAKDAIMDSAAFALEGLSPPIPQELTSRALDAGLATIYEEGHDESLPEITPSAKWGYKIPGDSKKRTANEDVSAGSIVDFVFDQNCPK